MIVNSSQHGRHLARHATRDDHYVSLSKEREEAQVRNALDLKLQRLRAMHLADAERLFVLGADDQPTDAAAQGVKLPPDAYAIVPDAAVMPLVLKTLQALRAAGCSVQMHAAGPDGLGSMKSQFKKADASGARFALIFGADEIAQGQVAVKALRDGASQC